MNDLQITSLKIPSEQWSSFFELDGENTRCKINVLQNHYTINTNNKVSVNDLPFYCLSGVFTENIAVDKQWKSCYFISSSSHLPISFQTHKSLCFFTVISVVGTIHKDSWQIMARTFSFYLRHSCFFKDNTLHWTFKEINTNIIRDMDVSLNFLEIDARIQPVEISGLKVKSYNLFDIYCRLSSCYIPPIILEKESKPLFNFALWYSTLQRYNLISICGYFTLSAGQYSSEIYVFMQYTGLKYRIHAIYSHKEGSKLFFWAIIDNENSVKLFREENLNICIVVEEKLDEREEGPLYKRTKIFLKNNMELKRIDYEKTKKMSNKTDFFSNFCDYRLANFYIGVYHVDANIMEKLYQNVTKNAGFFVDAEVGHFLGFGGGPFEFDTPSLFWTNWQQKQTHI